MTIMKSFVFYSVILLAGVASISGCQMKNSSKDKPHDKSLKALKLLGSRVKKLEEVLLENSLKKQSPQPSKSYAPIKTLTLRLGTKDDRLRIYWSDGTNSDLPCTKEQSTWVCG